MMETILFALKGLAGAAAAHPLAALVVGLLGALGVEVLRRRRAQTRVAAAQHDAHVASVQQEAAALDARRPAIDATIAAAQEDLKDAARAAGVAAGEAAEAAEDRRRILEDYRRGRP